MSPPWGVSTAKQLATLSLKEAVDGDGFGNGAVSQLTNGPGAFPSSVPCSLGSTEGNVHSSAPVWFTFPMRDQGCVFNQLYTVDKLCIWKGIGVTEASLSYLNPISNIDMPTEIRPWSTFLAFSVAVNFPGGNSE